MFLNHSTFSTKVFNYIYDVCKKKKDHTEKEDDEENDDKIIEEGMRMLTFISENNLTHKKILDSKVLQEVYRSIKPDSYVIFQLCSTVILHIGLNPDNHMKIIAEPIASLIKELPKKQDYFIQMNILTVLKILMTGDNEQLRQDSAKVYLDTVISTTAPSKFSNVLVICGFILQYY